MAAIFEEFANGDAFNANDFNVYSMRQSLIACDNQTDRDSIVTPQAGLHVWRKDTDAIEIYDGTSWNNVPRVLSRTVLTVAGDTITCNNLPDRDFLIVRIAAKATGGTLHIGLRLNNDSASNYNIRYSNNGAADTTPGAGTYLTDSGTIQNAFLFEGKLENISNEEKIMSYVVSNGGATGAANPPNRQEGCGKWVNTSTRATRVDAINTGTGDFAIGSIMEIIG